MSLKDDIRLLRGYNQFAVQKNLEGVTQRQSLLQPEPGGNCLNWVLGHIVHHRSPMLRLLGEGPVWTEEEAAPYVRGSEPLREGENALSVERMLGDLEASHARLDAALERVSDEDLAKPSAIDEKRSVGTVLLSLQFHEAYHAGQLGTLRRFAGLDPALK